jgi:hypothetical protein
MKNHGKSRKIMKNHGKSRKNNEKTNERRRKGKGKTERNKRPKTTEQQTQSQIANIIPSYSNRAQNKKEKPQKKKR